MIGARAVQGRPNPKAISEGFHSEAQSDFNHWNQQNDSIYQNYLTSCEAASGGLVVASDLLLDLLMGF